MTAFYHHSRLLRCRAPQGAVPCGTPVRLCADCALPEGASALVRLWEEGKSESFVPMTLDGCTAAATVVMPDRPCLVWYFFVLRLPDGETRYYGADSGEGVFSFSEPRAYQITVFDGAFETPKAFREGVAYQIFPDRFRRSSWEDFHARAQAHIAKGRHPRLHERWSENAEYLPAPGQSHYAPDDYFGGDLQGIREKLPYLASLGVTWIYLNPIFEAASNHRYNTADYLCVDPFLGTNDDFAALCRDARALGIRILLDGVFSHTGSDSRYFNKEGAYPEKGAYQGTDSPYYDWYTFTAYPDQYDCWWGFPTLPNVRELTPSYAGFIAGEAGVLAQWAKRGAAGWRLDVADELPDDFIRLLRSRLKAIDPEQVLLGEVWEDCSNKFGPEGRRDYVDGDLLDSAMNYPFSEQVVGFLTGKQNASALQAGLGLLREHYPKPFFDACLNLLSSHDNIRAQTLLSGAPDRRTLSREQQAVWRPTPESARLGRLRMIPATAIQVAHPGVPCVYYGDEAGMTGMSDPFNRETYPWGGEDQPLQEKMAKLLRARGACRALREGRCRMGALAEDVFALLRWTDDGKSCALLTVNRAERDAVCRIAADAFPEGPDGETPVPLAGAYQEVLTGAHAVFSDSIDVTVPPVGAQLWIRED